MCNWPHLHDMIASFSNKNKRCRYMMRDIFYLPLRNLEINLISSRRDVSVKY